MSDQQVQQLVIQRIHGSLEKAQASTASLRRKNGGLSVTGITGSAAATLVAGITSAAGPVVGSGIEAWRAACIAAAVFGFISTLALAFSQQMKLADRLVEGSRCTGELRALELAAATGSRPFAEIAAEYERLVKAYPDWS